MNQKIALPLLGLVALTAFLPAAWAQVDDAKALVMIVNMERIRAQLLLAERAMQAGDTEGAFAHSFISHTTIFPSVKQPLRDLDGQQATQIESALTDLPLDIRAGNNAQEITSEIGRITGMVDGTLATVGHEDDKGIVSQATAFLLRDAVQSYQLSEQGANIVDYENAGGLAEVAETKYLTIADQMTASRDTEIKSFFSELKTIIADKEPAENASRLAAAIERDLLEDLTVSTGATGGEHNQYFATIRELLAKVVESINAGDYDTADQHAITAYLDNYEYLEAPIEKHDAPLMLDIEIEMREELREMIHDGEPAAEIEEHVQGILVKLDQAEVLLDNDPELQNAAPAGQTGFADIEGLSQGFGSYEGERREIGEAEDPAKAAVRADIDQIRIKLDETLALYHQGNKEGALLTARSAYLDSYENIEIPLRPIDPDFTLEMEIKFAELRNLIQADAPYGQVLAKAGEIKQGLDESERLVQGTGILAPAIAFSTSFSIIFREGLESALIIGAILTYLEASRNEKFKKHVYYGIVLAFAEPGRRGS
ncbi:hypothetical protein [Candidatus Nitrososphaera sp. FF02]|uniref:hypothetical protein n=1 Tax=Candidatus Nitrososphaera sp. FF02 TaxID=3398226 RepID=UPI0039E913FB